MLTRLIAVVVAVLAAHASAWAQGTGDLEGTWTLVSSVVEQDGSEIDQFGPGAKGMLSLDARGRFMFTIIGADLPKFAANNRAGGSAEENKAVVSKSIAAFGSYYVDYASNTLVFKIDAATFPNWDSSEQRRSIIASAKRELKYVTAQASSGGKAIVTWKRAE